MPATQTQPKESSAPAPTKSKNPVKIPKVKGTKKAGPKKGKKKGGSQSNLRFTIDCTVPVQDAIMDAAAFETYLHQKMKVDGKEGVLGDKITIKRAKTKILISARPPFSKRYLKYLTKKYLKKLQLRDWLHVIASNKKTYELRYFNIHDEEEGGEEEEEAEEK